jgi:choline dehydrogenase-like flavoprotein
MIEAHTAAGSTDPNSVVWSRMGGGTHQLGTTRMASKAEDGVVNEHLAVDGMANLFVVSSSVLLTSSQANPTVMVIVLALRLADRLKLSLGGLNCLACRVVCGRLYYA